MGFAFLLVPIVILLVAGGMYYSYLQQKKRREELRALAAELDWRYDSGNHYDFSARYLDFAIFHQGHSQYAYNSLEGTIELGGVAWPARMGDFHYQVTTSNGKENTTHTYLFSYLIMQLPFVSAPGLVVRREGVFDRLKSAFGFDDIDFESAEFSRKFYVASPDKRFAYSVIHSGMMEFMLANAAPGIQIQSGRCCLSDAKGLWTTAEFRANIAWLRQFFELWPAHVVSKLQQQLS